MCPQNIICIPYYFKYEACCVASKSSTFRTSMLLIFYRVANVLLMTLTTMMFKTTA